MSCKSGDSKLRSALPPQHSASLSHTSVAYYHLRADYSIKRSGTGHTLASVQSVIHSRTLSAFYILWHAVKEETRHTKAGIHCSGSLSKTKHLAKKAEISA